MDTTSYNIALITRDGIRMDDFDASIPSSKHGYDIPVGEQVAIVANLMNRGLDRLVVKFGCDYCHICGKEAKLYQNNFIFLKPHILRCFCALRSRLVRGSSSPFSQRNVTTAGNAQK